MFSILHPDQSFHPTVSETATKQPSGDHRTRSIAFEKLNNNLLPSLWPTSKACPRRWSFWTMKIRCPSKTATEQIQSKWAWYIQQVWMAPISKRRKRTLRMECQTGYLHVTFFFHRRRNQWLPKDNFRRRLSGTTRNKAMSRQCFHRIVVKTALQKTEGVAQTTFVGLGS